MPHIINHITSVVRITSFDVLTLILYVDLGGRGFSALGLSTFRVLHSVGDWHDFDGPLCSHSDLTLCM